MSLRNLIVILGPTASGKSALGVALAKKFNGVIISADSRQVYRGLNIGAAKITRQEMKGVPHYLLDVASPRGQYSVARYVADVQRVLRRIPEHQAVFLVGGSPFYIKATTQPGSFANVKPDHNLRRRLATWTTARLIARLRELNPARVKTIDRANRRRLIRAIEIAMSPPARGGAASRVPTSGGTTRAGVVGAPPLRVLKLGLKLSRTKLYHRIDRRVDKRLTGIITETKKLHRQGLSWRRLDAFGLEYRYAARFLRGQVTRADMAAQLKSATHAFARRQLTWWRKDKDIHWSSSGPEIDRLARKFLQA